VPRGRLAEWYFERLDRWAAGRAADPGGGRAAVAALGGDPIFDAGAAAPWRHDPRVLAITSGWPAARPSMHWKVRAALLALPSRPPTSTGQATMTHMAGPLLVNGPIARDRHERRRQRLWLGQPGRPRRSAGRSCSPQCRRRLAGRPRQIDLGHPGKYTYAVAENEAESPFAPITSRRVFRRRLDGLRHAAEPPHSVTNHVADDLEGILDSICSAMSTIANNNAAVVGALRRRDSPEHARTIAAKGWSRTT
jgi:hypothetical protein